MSEDRAARLAALRQALAAEFTRLDAHRWGYDHGFCDDPDVDEETASFVDAAIRIVLDMTAPADAAQLRIGQLVDQRDKAWRRGDHWKAKAAEIEQDRDRATAERDAARAETERLRDLVADFVDPDPCEYDHHGYCQAHGWYRADPKCPHARAKELLPPATPAEEA